MEHNYRIYYQLGDSSFEVESTDKEWVDKKEKEYISKFSPQNIKSSRSPADTQKLEKKEILSPNLTINEFYRNHVKSKDIKSRPEMAVFFIYYLTKISKKDTIKTADVQQCFADISYPNYNKLNITDILSKAKRKALLNYVNNSWSLTLTGEDYVLNVITTSEE